MRVSSQKRAKTVSKHQQAIDFDRFVFAACKGVNTPYSLGIWIRYSARQFKDCLDAKVDPLNYNDAASFSVDFQIHSLFSKNRFLDLGVDKFEVAMSAARNAEMACKETNLRFRSRNFSLREEQLLSGVARKIEQILGPSPPVNWASRSGWGPGATASVKGNSVVLENKMCETHITVSSSAFRHLRDEMSLDIHWLQARGIDAEGPCTPLSGFKILNSNRVVAVPKNAKTDRIICAEPTGNIFLQKALGQVIRHRLKRYGINLNDQKRNQDLSQLAFSKSLATVDLKGASDHLCYELVRDLLPIEWFLLLDDLRVPSSIGYHSDKTVTRLEKFSSMGNGFTFELESLIFYAVTCVVDDSPYVSVYGDDIICSSAKSQDVISALQLIGFPVNVEKTFTIGNFFESCGMFWFKGQDVTPFFQKEPLDTNQELIRCANRISKWTQKHYWVLPCLSWTPLCGAWFLLARCVNDYAQPPGMEGDRGLIRDDWRKFLKWNKYRSYYQLPGLLFEPVLNKFYHPGAYIAYYYRFLPADPISDGLAFRGAGTYQKRWFQYNGNF